MTVKRIVDEWFKALDESAAIVGLTEEESTRRLKGAMMNAFQDLLDEAVDTAVDLALQKARQQYHRW